MLKLDIVIILSIKRQLHIDSSLTSSDLNNLLGEATVEELEFLKIWHTNLVSDLLRSKLNMYEGYSSEDVLKFSEIQHQLRFPISVSYIKNELRSAYILLFYIYKGFNVDRQDRIFNEAQLEAIKYRHGITIVNAGPGTGKTTTACKKAFTCREEGVIFISYTTTAVNEDKRRMYDHPGTSSLLFTQGFNKSYVFATIDKIAGGINGSISETYDHSIKTASDRIERGVSFKQKHIIVDEAQDIDEIRADFIFTLFFFGGFKSLTIFGDPRQKVNERAGRWYKNLWIHSGDFTYKQNTIHLNKIGFTESYRFKNVGILSLVNSLSARRPQIDCQLTVQSSKSEIPIEVFNIHENNENEIMTEVCTFIQNKHTEGLSYCEFIVVGPSLEADNKTSLLARKIGSFFRNFGIPCRLFSEGSYQSNGVLFSTIQSVKGLEADYIFLFGLNNYPHSFNMIPYDEAESLIYVCHSRARQKIFYINNMRSMVLPRGVANEYVLNNCSIHENTQKEETNKMTKKSVTSLLKCFDFQKLMEVNEVFLSITDSPLKFPHLAISDIPSDFFGTMIGIGIQMHCEGHLPDFYTDFINGQYNLVNKNIYNQLKRQDEFINGMDEYDTLYVQESDNLRILTEKITPMSIHSMSNSDYYILTTLFIYMSSQCMVEYHGHYDFDLQSYFEAVAMKITENFGKTQGTEVYVEVNNICGRIDIVTEKAIIELKTKNSMDSADALQCQLYKTLSQSHKQAVVINVKLNQTQVVHSNRIVEYWHYLVSKYDQIVQQISFTRYNSKKTIEFANNTFCVDTEFNPQNNEIFEISIFNINDPFRSIVQIIHVSKASILNGMQWLNLPEIMFTTAPTFDKFIMMFERLVFLYDSKPILYYYLCAVDVNWSKNSTHENVGKLTREVAVKNGTFSGPQCFPKLIDFYNSHIEFVIHQPHLKHHTALSDCLMLYSILKTFN